MNRKKAIFSLSVIIATLTVGAVSQAPKAPTLSTADKIALSAIGEQQQAAKKQFDQAQQDKMAILEEWRAGHPGWHVNLSTFVVEEDAKPAKAPEKAKP